MNQVNREATETRRERRAKRMGRLVTRKEARWAARVARVGYKLSGETGALKPPTKVHVGGGSRGRSSTAYLVEAAGKRLDPPVNHRRTKMWAEGHQAQITT